MMKITVHYWRGTQGCRATATTYRGALRIAARNQNAYDPAFYDPSGRTLIDDGHGLAYQDEADKGRTLYAV
jgi:hypothetical protein